MKYPYFIILITLCLICNSANTFVQQNTLVIKAVIGEKREFNSKGIENFNKDNEIFDDIWDVAGGACSWYCGNEVQKVKASSYLATQGKNNYTAQQADDGTLKTAWVEGKTDSGIGEYIEYYFKGSTKITSIHIYNGYIKSEQTWKDNNRIKKIALYINYNFYAFLELQDNKYEQIIKLPKVISNIKDGKSLILKFQINEVYQGEKYNDTAISEILFDGPESH